MLAFSFCPPPHGTPMAGEGVPHTMCGTKRARCAAPEIRTERSSLQCPPSAERAAACGVRKALRKIPRRGACAAVPSDACRIPIGCPPRTYRSPARHLSDTYQIQRCRNDKKFSRNGNTAKARRKDRNYNISAMPDPAALCATAK